MKTPIHKKGLVLMTPLGAQRYEQVFGKDTTEFEKGKRYFWDGESRCFKEVPKESEVRSQKPEEQQGPAIHADSRYSGYDPGLGCSYSCNSERKAHLRKINHYRAERGDPPLRERGY